MKNNGNEIDQKKTLSMRDSFDSFIKDKPLHNNPAKILGPTKQCVIADAVGS